MVRQLAHDPKSYEHPPHFIYTSVKLTAVPHRIPPVVGMSSPFDSDAFYEDLYYQWLIMSPPVPSTPSNEVVIEPNAAPDRSLGAASAEPLAERPPATVSGETSNLASPVHNA